jgi:hypothetical protein
MIKKEGDPVKDHLFYVRQRREEMASPYSLVAGGVGAGAAAAGAGGGVAPAFSMRTAFSPLGPGAVS